MQWATPSADALTLRAAVASATKCNAAQDASKGHVSARIGRFETDIALTAAQAQMLRRLDAYYTDDAIDEVLRPILQQHAGAPSIRSIDWCLTNFAKAHRVVLTQRDGTHANLWGAYKAALNFFRRRNFDAFRRRHRVTVRHPLGDLVSTVAQLNFYAWAHELGLLEFCRTHAAEIEAHMNAVSSSTKRHRAARAPGERRRTELTRADAGRIAIVEA